MSLEPRILTKKQAAVYCGLTESGFQAWIDAGRVPGPLPGTKRYDRLAIDRALNTLSGISNSEEASSAYDAWKRDVATSQTHQPDNKAAG